MTNIIKKIEYYFEATLEITITILIPLLLVTPLVLLLGIALFYAQASLAKSGAFFFTTG